MKKIWEFIKTFALSFAEKSILEEGGQALEKMLEKFREKNQPAADALVVSLYTLVETVGKDVVADTTNVFDDHALAEVKAELVEYATKHSVVLPDVTLPPTAIEPTP